MITGWMRRRAPAAQTERHSLTVSWKVAGLVEVSLHHSQVHGRRWLGHGSLTLGGVALGPVGADAHLLHAGELRRAAGNVQRVWKACGQRERSAGTDPNQQLTHGGPTQTGTND